MCLQPIQIINKTRSYIPEGSKVFQSVPCGSCSDCKSRQQDDWYIRAFFEWKRCQKKGGATWFVTLTYADEFLPHYEDEGFSFPCFCYEHILSFRKLLRQSLKRHLFNKKIEIYKKRHNVKRVPRDVRKELNSWSDTKMQGLRFVICSEFGGEKGRPHYHGLLFVPFYIRFDEMHRILQDKCWRYGMVRWSQDKSSKSATRYKPLILSSRGIKYVMKYISKDDSWSDKYNLCDYKDYLKSIGDKTRLIDFKRVSPRHYQSTYFGIDGLSALQKDGKFDKSLFVKDKFSLLSFGSAPDSKGREFPFHIPIYYVRKVCYDFDKVQGVYRLNDFGKDVYCAKFNKRLKFSIDYFNEWLQSKDVFVSKMFGIDIWKYASPKSVLHAFQTKGEIYSYILELLDGRPFDLLALYSSLYQGLKPTNYLYLKSLPYQEQLDLVLSGQYVANTLNAVINSDFDSVTYDKGDCEYTENPKYLYKNHTFGTLPIFDKFDYALSIIQQLEQSIGLARKIGKYIKDKELNNSLCVINKIRYGHV